MREQRWSMVIGDSFGQEVVGSDSSKGMTTTDFLLDICDTLHTLTVCNSCQRERDQQGLETKEIVGKQIGCQCQKKLAWQT